MRFRRSIRRLGAALLCAVAVAGQERAAIGNATSSLRGRIPDAALVTVECGDAGELLLAAERALGRLPDGLPAEAQAQIAAAMLAVRTFLQGAPSEVLRAGAGGGAAFGLLPAKPPAAVLVLRPGDRSVAAELLARLPARVHVRSVDDVALLASTADALAQLAAVTTPSRWATWPDASPPAPGQVRAYADLDGLRAVWPQLRDFGVERLDGGGRFVLTPIAAAIANASHLQTTLSFAAGGLQLELGADGTALGSRWQELLAAHAEPRALPPVPAGTLAWLSLDRSLRQLFEHPERFLAEPGARAVQSFLSVADQLDGARTSFVRDLVGSLGEPITAMLLPTAAADTDDVPPLLLPGLAFVAPLLRASAQQDLERMASVFLLIANSERARQQRTLFVQRPVRDGEITGTTTRPQPWRGPGAPPIEQALSPTLLFARGHVVLASTFAAADAIARALAAAPSAPQRGDVFAADGGALAEALLQNRAPLALARQLDEGETAATADRFVATLAAALRVWPQWHLQVEPGATATTLRLSLERP